MGAARNIGLFGILELVRDRATYEPMAPYNGTSDEMKAVGKHLRDNGLYTFVRWNTIQNNPPLTITEDELAEGFDIIDGALEHADKGVRALDASRADRWRPAMSHGRRPARTRSRRRDRSRATVPDARRPTVAEARARRRVEGGRRRARRRPRRAAPRPSSGAGRSPVGPLPADDARHRRLPRRRWRSSGRPSSGSSATRGASTTSSARASTTTTSRRSACSRRATSSCRTSGTSRPP